MPIWFAADQFRQSTERDFLTAASQGNVGRLTELADKVNIDARLSEDGETALHRAASRGHLKAVALLLDRGATVDAVDGEGVTPLILASYRGKTEVAKLLLERGAGVNAQEKRNGLSSLSHAVGRGDKDLVSVLLAHGADPLLKSADGRTPLERAEANGASEIVALLKQAKPKK
ncbi:MAG TPA: ankyrin repeat domain-containing protein [Burkholderiales bacterium]|nr:ankyrin repeat domain-containing protein [Burkholderiales bacterium]